MKPHPLGRHGSVTVRSSAAALTILLASLQTVHSVAAAQAATTPPADYGPVSINLEDVPYPYPVSFLSFTLYGQDVRMAYMDVKPVGAANGQSVVLLHGFNFFGEYWGGTADVLSRNGYRVVVIDQIGFGRSSKPIIPYSLNDMAANTRRLLGELGIERAAIVGHSMGGMLASRFAFAYPGVTTHVVMVNQIGLTDSRIGRAPRLRDDIYRGSLARSYQSIRQGIERYFVKWDPAYEKYIRIHYGWTLSGDWPRFAMVRSALQQIISGETVVYDWPHIRSKALVIGGMMDGPNYPAQARRVSETIPGARLELIENTGHNPHLESPQVFHAKLLEFLKS
jgi:pimeloyl-ACP methyl ester carboxylesterase